MLRLLRAHVTATLLTHDQTRATATRLVIDPASGRLVSPVSPELLESQDFLLVLPDESEALVQVGVEPEVTDARSDAAVDRHRAYHGMDTSKSWVRWSIISARGVDPTLGAVVADGEDLMVPSPLVAIEPKLVRLANTDPSRLRAWCLARSGAAVEAPVAVGVDPDGVDIRARYGIIRVAFDVPLDDAASAEDALRRLLDQGTSV
jgi:hypothetical protein